MKQSKTFVEISKKMEALSKNAKGQLKGGFAVFSGYGGPGDPEKPTDPSLNPSCTNNCNCTNDKKKCGNSKCSIVIK